MRKIFHVTGVIAGGTAILVLINGTLASLASPSMAAADYLLIGMTCMVVCQLLIKLSESGSDV